MADSLKSQIAELRQAVEDYIPGSRIGLDLFADADPGEMDNMTVRIGIFGMTGVGKSAFINTLEKIIKRRAFGSAITQGEGKEGTIILEEYFPEYKFHLVDTRGFMDLDEEIQQGEFFRILYGCSQSGAELIRDHRAELLAALTGKGGHRLPKQSLTKQIHGIIWVINGIDVRLQKRMYAHNLQYIREQLKREAVTIVTVITYNDKLDDEGRKLAKKNAQEITGSSDLNTFFLETWYSKENEYSDENKLRALEVLNLMLKHSEDSIKVRQTRRKMAEYGM